jgi:hypothetical protein
VRFSLLCGLHSEVCQQIYAVAADIAAARIEHELQMRNSKTLIYRSVRIGLSMLLLSAVTIAAWPQTAPDFSGMWKQDNDRCQPKRSGDVTLHIEHHNPELTVETSISHGAQISRHACRNIRPMARFRYRREPTEASSAHRSSGKTQASSS